MEIHVSAESCLLLTRVKRELVMRVEILCRLEFVGRNSHEARKKLYFFGLNPYKEMSARFGDFVARTLVCSKIFLKT